MNYLNPLNNRLNGGAWKSGFGNLESQLGTLFANLPSNFDFDASDFLASNSAPSARWYESDDAYIARLDLPGLKVEDIALELSDEVIALSAERKEADGKAEDGQTSSIRYTRRVVVPEGVDAEKISAAYENGVLSLTFPKSEKVKPRTITVSAR